MKRVFAAVIAIFFLYSLGRASVVLTGFGAGDFSLDGSSIISGGAQDSNGYTFTANDQSGSFAGTFNSVNIVGQSDYIILTAVVSNMNPLSNFTIQLADSSFNLSDYSGNWSSFTTGVSSSILIPFVSADAGFDYTSVIGMQIVFGGNGSGNLTINLDSLSSSAIPESATYAGLLGGAVLGLAVWRKRRKFV